MKRQKIGLTDSLIRLSVGVEDIDDLIEDLKNAYKYVIANKDLEGIFNLTAPVPTTNLGLTKALGKSLKRPTLFPVPEFVLKLIFSEGAKVLTDGQKAVPKKLQDHGFNFKYLDIENAIDDLVV